MSVLICGLTFKSLCSLRAVFLWLLLQHSISYNMTWMDEEKTVTLCLAEIESRWFVRWVSVRLEWSSIHSVKCYPHNTYQIPHIMSVSLLWWLLWPGIIMNKAVRFWLINCKSSQELTFRSKSCVCVWGGGCGCISSCSIWVTFAINILKRWRPLLKPVW